MAKEIIKTYRNIGNWDIGLIKYNNNKRDIFPYVRGLYYGENPFIDNNYKVGFDRPENIPNSVIKYVENNAKKIKNDIDKMIDGKTIDELKSTLKELGIYINKTKSIHLKVVINKQNIITYRKDLTKKQNEEALLQIKFFIKNYKFNYIINKNNNIKILK